MTATTPAIPLEASAAPQASSERLERLFVDQYRFVWRTLRRLGVQESRLDDCVQHVFLVTSKRLQDVPPEKERAFLTGVVMRVAANTRRSQDRVQEDPDPGEIATYSTSTSPEELLEWKRRRDKVDEWLAALEIELRAPFVLFELEGLSLPEIAELLTIPLGTAKSRLRRARAIIVERARSEGVR